MKQRKNYYNRSLSAETIVKIKVPISVYSVRSNQRCIPVPVYNWIVDFFCDHAHRTMFNGDWEESTTASISASIIHGSGIGPAAFTVTAADLKPLHPGNSLVKFADDTYLVIPSINAGTRQQEMDNIATWAVSYTHLTLPTNREV